MTEKEVLVKFHSKLRQYCQDRALQCDGGNDPDCPFVEYCFRAAAELQDDAVALAFEELNRI